MTSALLRALLASAFAYETDQLTRRSEPLADARVIANAEVNHQLAGAIEETNAALGCRGSRERTRRELASRIYARLATPSPVPSRQGLEGLGFGAFGAFLETGPIARRDFMDRSDIYRQLSATQSPALATVGVCSTIRLAGVLMGTDKPDHFFGQGYDYLRVSRWGAAPLLALQWGMDSERGAYGLLTSNVFSFADLHANRRGFAFYAGLLSRNSGMQRDGAGCVATRDAFDWADWVDDAFDELLNPSTYGLSVGAAVAGQLALERDDLCAGYRRWGADVEARRLRVRTLVRGDAWRGAPAPPEGGELAALCGVSPPVVTGPFLEAPATMEVPGAAVLAK